MRQTGVSPNVVNAFTTFLGSTLSIDVSQNGITSVPGLQPIVGVGCHVNLNLSYNRITSADNL